MFNVNHILIASDLTQNARAALQRAAQLKQDLGARLTLLHVVDPKTPAVQSEQHARSILQEHVGSVFASEPRHFGLEIRHGDRYDTIIAEAEAAGADLIVLGDAQQRRWNGTTTERVVRMSQLPVLVVRRPGGQPYQRLLSAFDGSPAACRALAVALAVAGEAKCLVFHASITPTLAQFATRRAGDAIARHQVDAVMAALEGLLKRVGPLRARPEVRVLEGNPHFLVRDSMREFAPDLLTVGTHARSSAATAVLGSFAYDLLGDAACDVLIAPPDGA
ncbi:MAG TPA: universal stress protein [Hyphomicrobiaceae bacterium]|jgi:nucleotide-binding universal stress UspA family protein|nr:universal stress protein [Hyphomicrobiaceae bacterium]